jgi:hypothetical protein
MDNWLLKNREWLDYASICISFIFAVFAVFFKSTLKRSKITKRYRLSGWGIFTLVVLIISTLIQGTKKVADKKKGSSDRIALERADSILQTGISNQILLSSYPLAPITVEFSIAYDISGSKFDQFFNYLKGILAKENVRHLGEDEFRSDIIKYNFIQTTFSLNGFFLHPREDRFGFCTAGNARPYHYLSYIVSSATRNFVLKLKASRRYIMENVELVGSTSIGEDSAIKSSKDLIALQFFYQVEYSGVYPHDELPNIGEYPKLIFDKQIPILIKGVYSMIPTDFPQLPDNHTILEFRWSDWANKTGHGLTEILDTED